MENSKDKYVPNYVWEKIGGTLLIAGAFVSSNSLFAATVEEATYDHLIRLVTNPRFNCGLNHEDLSKLPCPELYSALGSRMVRECEGNVVTPAVGDVLTAMSRRGEPPPTYLINIQSPDFMVSISEARKLETNWEKNLRSKGIVPKEYETQGRIKPLFPRLTDAIGALYSEVYKTRVQEKKEGPHQNPITRYFRPVGLSGHQYGRWNNGPGKTFAASWLNRALGIKTVPVAEIARVNGRWGVLSEEAPGSRIYFSLPINLNERSLSNAVAFEFLIGQADGQPRNFHVTKEGEIYVLDHDRAFSIGIPYHSQSDRPPRERADLYFGTVLPKKYTREFIENLRKLDVDEVRDVLSPHLTEVELRGLEFRRRVILQDVKRRGEGAIFSE